MNIKIHTPKSLKSGSGMATTKQFLLSLVATTISIILTFGTHAWVDSRKKKEAKREMVMMILYDLSNSLEQIQGADSILRKGLDQQVAIAANPELLTQNPFTFTRFVPNIEYTETVEHIFSTNIETINTIGNVFFAENVSDLYRLRRNYKTEICDEFHKDLEKSQGFKDYDDAMNIGYAMYVFQSSMICAEMEEKITQCKQMMHISEKALEAYHKKRNDITNSSKADSTINKLTDELRHNYERLKRTMEKAK
ncbi:MAG: hypothetical protein J5867_09100 [Prevotella sp.]|nr:hypothetical protein [Prevotella sp.]